MPCKLVYYTYQDILNTGIVKYIPCYGFYLCNDSGDIFSFRYQSRVSLTPQQVIELRNDYLVNNTSSTALSKKYGISFSYIILISKNYAYDWIKLHPVLGKNKRLYVTLKGNVKRYVHHLVLETFNRFAEPGEQCRHLNGVSTDNRLGNLCWGTQVENEADKRKHGTLICGEKHYKHKLKSTDIIEIKRLYNEIGLSQKTISEIYNVSDGHISCIINNKKWRHIV